MRIITFRSQIHNGTPEKAAYVCTVRNLPVYLLTLAPIRDLSRLRARSYRPVTGQRRN
jgi:hypothetical protein